MRIRKSVLFGFISSIILAAYLGFADISLPHDKWIHFTMFFVMSFLFYWILDSNSMRTIRNITFIICTLIGGVGSEFVQHIIAPKRTFDVYDILANVSGSVLAVVGSNYYHSHMLKQHRKYRIRRTAIDIESYLSESSNSTDIDSTFTPDAEEFELDGSTSIIDTQLASDQIATDSNSPFSDPRAEDEESFIDNKQNDSAVDDSLLPKNDYS